MYITDGGVKVKVVYNKKTLKLIPFSENAMGEIIILTTGNLGNPEDICVGLVDPKKLDLLNGYIREDIVSV